MKYSSLCSIIAADVPLMGIYTSFSIEIICSHSAWRTVISQYPHHIITNVYKLSQFSCTTWSLQGRIIVSSVSKVVLTLLCLPAPVCRYTSLLLVPENTTCLFLSQLTTNSQLISWYTSINCNETLAFKCHLLPQSHPSGTETYVQKPV